MKRTLFVVGLLVLWLNCAFAQFAKPIRHPARSPKAFTYKKAKPKKHRAPKPYHQNQVRHR